MDSFEDGGFVADIDAGGRTEAARQDGRESRRLSLSEENGYRTQFDVDVRDDVDTSCWMRVSWTFLRHLLCKMQD